MRILFVTEYLPPRVSGIAERCKQYITGLRKLGHEVIVWGVCGCDLSDHDTLSIPNLLDANQRFALWDPKLIWAVLTQKWDVIHVVTPGNINMWPILTIAKFRRIQTCVSYHVLLSHYGPRYFHKLFYPFAFAIVGWGYLGYLAYMADVVAVPSSAPLEDFRLIKPRQTYRMKCGVDKNRFYPHLNSELPILCDSDGRHKVTYVGRLSIEKDVQFLVKAMKSDVFLSKKCRLHIVGDGPESSNLRNLVDELNIHDIVTFHGMKSGEELRCLYANSAVVVTASCSETFGFTNAEAMACGTPCVIVRGGAFPEVYKTLDDMGWMFEPGDVDGYSWRVRMVIEQGGMDVRDQAKRIADEEFSWDAAVKGMIDHCYISNNTIKGN